MLTYVTVLILLFCLFCVLAYDDFQNVVRLDLIKFDN